MHTVNIERLIFSYKHGYTLNIDRLEIAQGKLILLKGTSGSGKTTLLNIIAGFYKPDSGCVYINNLDWQKAPKSKLNKIRAENIGFIFQQFNLLSFLSVTDNILMPLHFSRNRYKKALGSHNNIYNAIQELLEKLNIAHIQHKPINKLSTGQAQRVACARALIGKPSIIIADEPTANLDADNANNLLKILTEQANNHNTTVIIASHQQYFNSVFDMNLHIENNTINVSA